MTLTAYQIAIVRNTNRLADRKEAKGQTAAAASLRRAAVRFQERSEELNVDD